MTVIDILERHDKAIARLRIATKARQSMAAELDAAIRHAYRIGIPQGRIGAVVGLTQPRISQIISEGTEFLT